MTTVNEGELTNSEDTMALGNLDSMQDKVYDFRYVETPTCTSPLSSTPSDGPTEVTGFFQHAQQVAFSGTSQEPITLKENGGKDHSNSNFYSSLS